MKFASIGTRAAWPLLRLDRKGKRGGFTLLEALVALAVVVAFAAVLAPMMSQARRIVFNAEPRVAAQGILRSLMDPPLRRSNLTATSREGETAGLRWRVVVRPIFLDALPPPSQGQTRWMAFRVNGTVAWGPDQAVSAESIWIGKPE